MRITECLCKNLEGVATVTLILDAATVQMCLAYNMNPAPWLDKALKEELHTRALMHKFNERTCPHCGKVHK